MSLLVKYSSPAGSIFLPSSYTRLAYIQSTGTQWVDCGVKANLNTKIYGKFYALSGGCPLFGARASGVSSSVISIWPNTAADTHRFHDKAISVHTPLNLFLDCDVSKNGYRLNGTNYLWGTVADFTSAVNIHIFASASNNTGIEARCYAFRIWNGNTIVRDMVPVQKSDGTIGLLDLVNNTFYGNSGTGTFIAGPECPQGFPTSEYCLVEWLEGTGELYIDTGTKLTANFKIKTLLIPREFGNSAMAYGTYVAGNRYDLQFNSGFWSQKGNTAIYQGTIGLANLAAMVDKYFDIEDTLSTFKVNGTNYHNGASPTFSDPGYNLYLFTGSTSQYFAKVRICGFQLYNSSTLVHHLIPCYRRSDMKPGMYDLVSRTFLTNNGTGEFLLGPSITFGYGEVVNGSLDKRLKMYQWLEASGTLYIDTGVTFDNKNTVLNISTTAKGLNNWNGITGGGFFGAKNSIYSNNTTSSTISTTERVHIGLTLDFKSNYNTQVITSSSKSETIQRTIGSASNYTSAKFYLFAYNSGSNTPSGYSSGLLEITHIYKNGIMIRDLHPASLNGVYGMYDALNDVFYNNVGSGSFTVGPETTCVSDKYALHAIPHNISSEEGRRGEKNGSFCGGGNGYLEFDSMPATSIKTVAFWVKSNKSNLCFYADPTAKTACGFWNNYMIISCNSNSLHTFPITAFTADVWNHIAITYGSTPEVWINGVKQTANAGTDYWSWAGSSKAYLFARYNNGLGQFSSGYIQDFQIWDEVKNPIELM